MSMQLLSQQDQRWATKQIGSGPLTIGRWGCTLTCVSMLSDKFGCYVSPDALAARKELFNAKCEIIWANLPRGIEFVERYRNGERKTAIAAAVASMTQGVILNVNGDPTKPAVSGAHWIAALRPAGNDWVCADPWTGKECLAKRDYRNIMGYVVLGRTGVPEQMPVDVQYGKKRNLGAEIAFFTLGEVQRFFRTRQLQSDYLDQRTVNAVVYGGWSLAEVREPTRFGDWTTATKEEWSSALVRVGR